MANMEYVTVEIKDANGKIITSQTADFRTFKSGKKGWGAYGKVNVGSDRAQLSFNLVKIEP